MQAEGVVAPRHVAEVALEPLVVLGVDDLLLPPGTPGMGPRRHQQRLAFPRQPEQPSARLPLAGDRRRERVALVRPDLDLGRDQLARDAPAEDLVRLGRAPELLE